VLRPDAAVDDVVFDDALAAVVVKADLDVPASRELVELWRAGGSDTFTLEHTDVGDVVRFGTEGEGLGVVTYRIDATSLEDETVQLRRIA